MHLSLVSQFVFLLDHLFQYAWETQHNSNIYLNSYNWPSIHLMDLKNHWSNN